MKIKSSFYCSNCGAESPKWIGKCPSCEEWNTYHEEIIEKATVTTEKSKIWQNPTREKVVPKKLSDVSSLSTIRTDTLDGELNRVLGGGLVAGSIILVGGQPGIGKSTLLLQVALKLQKKVLYVSGEESEEQIKMRADRIGMSNPTCYIYTEVNVSKLLKEAIALEPDMIIIDSVQTLVSPFIDSAPGSISQIRECTSELQRFAKEIGLNRWADIYDLVVIYPQTRASFMPLNPKGCWDWWGYSGANYDTRDGRQLGWLANFTAALGIPLMGPVTD